MSGTVNTISHKTVPRLTWKSEEKKEAQKWNIWQTLVEERRKIHADWSLNRHIFLYFKMRRRCFRNIFKKKFFLFSWTVCSTEALEWKLVLWPSGSADAHRERRWGVDATVQNAYSRRPDPKFGEAKRSLAPDLMACWIRPRESTSEQPVLLAPGTEGKLHTHKVALWHGCKMPRNNHIRSYFKKW